MFVYKCVFSSVDDLTKIRKHYNISLIGYNIKSVMKNLRSCGYHLGKDFVYWKFVKD